MRGEYRAKWHEERPPTQALSRGGTGEHLHWVPANIFTLYTRIVHFTN